MLKMPENYADTFGEHELTSLQNPRQKKTKLVFNWRSITWNQTLNKYSKYKLNCCLIGGLNKQKNFHTSISCWQFQQIKKTWNWGKKRCFKKCMRLQFFNLLHNLSFFLFQPLLNNLPKCLFSLAGFNFIYFFKNLKNFLLTWKFTNNCAMELGSVSSFAAIKLSFKLFKKISKHIFQLDNSPFMAFLLFCWQKCLL